jgi:DNA-binding CsgD family transcriptional regulator
VPKAEEGVNETPEAKVSETEAPIENDAQLEAAEEKAAKKSKKSKPKKPEAKFKVGQRIHVTSLKQRDEFRVPEDEEDPHWDPKLKNPVPEGVVDSLVDFGWDETQAALALTDGTLVHGRTRWRALSKADTIRKNNKLGHVEPWVVITEEKTIEDAVHLMERNVTLNFSVQDIDPMTKAESIYRLMSAGVDDKTNAKRHNCSVNDVHGYVLLLDEDKCPPNVQEMLRAGQISFTAALELARKAESMTKAELSQAAEQIAKISSGGLKVTAAQVKRAAGVEGSGPATQKEKKQLILDLQSGELRGKFGEACKWAAIVALEVGLGTRTVDSAWSALGKLAQGQTIRVDFKQYIPDSKVGEGMGGGVQESKAVKGQEAKPAPKKKVKKAKK